MKNQFLIFFTFFLFASNLLAQEAKEPVPRFKKYDIAQTGCKVYMPDDPQEFSVSKSQDGSEVYIGETSFGSYDYGIICIKLLEPIAEKNERVQLLENYMSFLKSNFGIVAAAGYGKGHTLESNPQADGIIDYWEDSEDNKWQVKGWVDSNFLAILFVYGPDEHPYFNAVEIYLNGFRFLDN